MPLIMLVSLVWVMKGGSSKYHVDERKSLAQSPSCSIHPTPPRLPLTALHCPTKVKDTELIESLEKKHKY